MSDVKLEMEKTNKLLYDAWVLDGGEASLTFIPAIDIEDNGILIVKDSPDNERRLEYDILWKDEQNVFIDIIVPSAGQRTQYKIVVNKQKLNILIPTDRFGVYTALSYHRLGSQPDLMNDLP